MEKRVEQEKVVWSAKITKYQIRNILFLLYIYGLIIVIHLTGPQPIQLVLNPFNWSPNSSTGLFSAKMANFDKTNWYYLFIVHPPNPVKWSQAHSTGPHPIQLVPKFQYWLIVWLEIRQEPVIQTLVTTVSPQSKLLKRRHYVLHI